MVEFFDNFEDREKYDNKHNMVFVTINIFMFENFIEWYKIYLNLIIYYVFTYGIKLRKEKILDTFKFNKLFWLFYELKKYEFKILRYFFVRNL